MLIKINKAQIKHFNEKGEGVAVVATLNVIDSDNDVTLPGAFGEQVVPVVPAHNWQEAPIGKARVLERDNEAIAEFQLNLKTDEGRNWYEALKFDIDHPPAKQQWSYGFTVKEQEFGEFEGQKVRFLKSLLVHEISPVLLGAGVGVRTLALKGHKNWITAEQMEKICPPCAEKMRSKHISRLSLAELIKQGFTCPKPFATFAECVNRFQSEDIDDPEAFCAAWEAFCEGKLVGERGAVAGPPEIHEGQLTMAEQMALAIRNAEAAVARLEEIAEMRARDGREFSRGRTDGIKTLRNLITRLDALVGAPHTSDVVKQYFELKLKKLRRPV